MRIIAGIARSVPLITAKGDETRPTTDKVKETLFNMLQGFVSDATFLDLFAGSGQIGLEALSRGAKEAVFVERYEDSVKCIKTNIKKTKFEDKAPVLKMDVLAAIRALQTEKKVFDLIFMDPPYGKGMERPVLEALSSSNILASDCLIVIEADRNLDFSYVEDLDYMIVKDKIYKNNRHIFLRKNKSEGNCYE